MLITWWLTGDSSAGQARPHSQSSKYSTPPFCAAATDPALWENWPLFGDFCAPFLKWSWFFRDLGVIWSNFVKFCTLGGQIAADFPGNFHGDIWYLNNKTKQTSEWKACLSFSVFSVFSAYATVRPWLNHAPPPCPMPPAQSQSQLVKQNHH